ncbi:hypothetical protein EYR36_010660 [Pleurotus pulmonarius]|nr:hypothetical protein EYR36_010660 [Pleurotus pulmonarius]KAF4590565.1 hypothetical protein EYR38_009867 [Pleurotus pulmonarius]
MGPGRPKIYTTPEDQLEANRAKNRRSYHKNKLTTSTSSKPPKCLDSVTAKKSAGRPKIYKSPEEKARANRAKSKRSYDKRKAAIGAKRAIRYRAETAKYILRP